MINDIIELRNTGNDGSDISINLINNGVPFQLEGFGPGANLNYIEIDGDNNICRYDVEASSFLKIQNGKILESECRGKLTLKGIQDQRVIIV